MFIAIVPAYNEEKTIGSVVRDLFNHADKVIAVDDGSKDDTTAIASAAGAVVLRHVVNRGQGAALQTGHDYALQIGADYVIDFDADGQFDADDIKPTFEALKKSGADILFGSRFLDRRSNVPWLKKYFILPMARFFNRLFGGLALSDAHNGFRILNRRALQAININQDRMAHATEIQVKVKKHGLKFIEFPVKIVYREYGQGWAGGIKVIKDLFLGFWFRH